MRLMFLMISLALIALGIAACAGSVQVVSASSDAAMLKHSADSGRARSREPVRQLLQEGPLPHHP